MSPPALLGLSPCCLVCLAALSCWALLSCCWALLWLLLDDWLDGNRLIDVCRFHMLDALESPMDIVYAVQKNVHMAYTYSASTKHIQDNYTTHVKRILYKYWANTVHIPYRYGTHIVQISYKYRSHIVYMATMGYTYRTDIVHDITYTVHVPYTYRTLLLQIPCTWRTSYLVTDVWHQDTWYQVLGAKYLIFSILWDAGCTW